MATVIHTRASSSTTARSTPSTASTSTSKRADPRLPRPERRGEIHHHPRPARTRPRHLRRGHRLRRRPVARRRRPAPPHRLRARRCQPLAEPLGRRGDRPARAPARRAAPGCRLPGREGAAHGRRSSSTRARRAGPTRRATARRSRSSRRWPCPRTSTSSTSRRAASTRSWRSCSGRRSTGSARPERPCCFQPHPVRGRAAVRPGQHHPRRAGSSSPARSPSCGTSPAPRCRSTPTGAAPADIPGAHDVTVSEGRARFTVDSDAVVGVLPVLAQRDVQGLRDRAALARGALPPPLRRRPDGARGCRGEVMSGLATAAAAADAPRLEAAADVDRRHGAARLRLVHRGLAVLRHAAGSRSAPRDRDGEPRHPPLPRSARRARSRARSWCS